MRRQITSTPNPVLKALFGSLLVLVAAAAGVQRTPAASPQIEVALTPTGAMTVSRTNHTATLLNDGRILVAGGYQGGGSGLGYLTLCELYDPRTGAWSVTGPLTTGRSRHTATLLDNGKVLVAGGTDASGHSLGSAELYDPSTGVWTSAGTLGYARYNHTATRLADGKVLFAGGYYNDGSTTMYLQSAEIYNQDAGTWSGAGTLATGRSQHTATLLPSGKVLVAGGYNGSYLSSCELYTPASGTGSWAATGTLFSTRREHAAVLLATGKVLVAAGYGGTGPAYLTDCELYDPAGGGWSPTTGGMTNGRRGMGAALLPSGKVLILGGYNTATPYMSDGELYDPAAGTWGASSVSLATARRDHTATLTAEGRVLVAGGRSNASVYEYSCELYDPSSPSWATANSLNTGRYAHTATLLPNGKILVAGGHFTSGVTAAAELYDPSTGNWTTTGSLITARGNHTATLLPTGKVLVAGGADGGGSAMASAELFDPAADHGAGAWSATGAMNGVHEDHTATQLADGKVLVASGGSGCPLCAEVYDPAAGTWTRVGDLGASRNYHRAALLPDGRVLVAGGQPPTGGGDLATCEVYDPATRTWSPTDSLTTARRNFGMTLLPNGMVLAAGGSGSISSCELYDPGDGTWSPTGSLIAARSDASGALLLDGRFLMAGGSGSGLLSSSEAYDPASGTWSSCGTFTTARYDATATLMASGGVLLAGGATGSGATGTCRLFDPGLGFAESRRPVITATSSPFTQPGAFLVSGSGFIGDSECGGSAVNGSASNAPTVALQRVDGDMKIVLEPDWGQVTNWTDTLFRSESQCGLPRGHYRATVYSRGIPASSKVLLVNGPTATVTGTQSICSGDHAVVQAALTGSSPWTVTWSDGLVQSGLTTSPATRNESPATTTVYAVTAVEGQGCAGTAFGEAVVTVTSRPGSAGPIGSNAPLCSPPGARQDLHLNCQFTPGATAYRWEGPNGWTATGASPVITAATPANSGTYTVWAVKDGCDGPPSSRFISVHETYPENPGDDLVATKVGNDIVFTWGAIPHADGYNLYYGSSPCIQYWPDPNPENTWPSGWEKVNVSPIQGTTFTYEGAAGYPSFLAFHITGVNNCGENFQQPR